MTLICCVQKTLPEPGCTEELTVINGYMVCSRHTSYATLGSTYDVMISTIRRDAGL
jgi:hypothetical protein